MRNLKFTFFLLAIFLTGTIFAQTDTIKAYQITLDKKYQQLQSKINIVREPVGVIPELLFWKVKFFA